MSQKVSADSLSADTLAVLKAFDAILSSAGNQALAAAMPSDETIVNFAQVTVAVQNVLCDLQMFLMRRIAGKQALRIDNELTKTLSARFNRISKNPPEGELIRAEIVNCSQKVLDLLLCLDADSFEHLPAEDELIPEFLVRAMAVVRDLTWLHEFHTVPALTAFVTQTKRS